MGNLVTASGSIFAPFLTTEVIIPFIYNPIRFNNIPFVAPSTLKYMFLYILINVLIVFSLGVVGSTMSTLKECHRMDLLTSMLSTKWPILFTIIGLIILYLLPIIKTPLLVVMGWLPYSNLFVTGLFLSLFVLIGGYLGNKYARERVCQSS